MSYDPSFPATGVLIGSAAFRSQFQALKALIDAVSGITGVAVDGVTTLNPGDPATVTLSLVGGVLHVSFGIPVGMAGVNGQDGGNGQDGQDGAVGPPFTNFVIDSVTTLPPGTPATVQAVFDGGAVKLSLGIPQGVAGQDGVNGLDGGVGPVGPQGLQGPPFTMIVIDTVTTLPPGDPATAAAAFDGTAVRLSLGIPRGLSGAQGPAFAAAVVDSVTTLNPGENATALSTFDGSTVHLTLGLPRGADGAQGLQGNQGAPGEISAAQLAAAIGWTSSNTNAVATLDTPFANDPPTLADLETMRAKFNELTTALRR